MKKTYKKIPFITNEIKEKYGLKELYVTCFLCGSDVNKVEDNYQIRTLYRRNRILRDKVICETCYELNKKYLDGEKVDISEIKEELDIIFINKKKKKRFMSS